VKHISVYACGDPKNKDKIYKTEGKRKKRSSDMKMP
jgi:hypothetical protein